MFKRGVGKPRKFPTVESMADKMQEYFDKEDYPYTVGAMALYLNLTYEGLSEYGRRTEYSELITLAKMKIEDNINRGALKGNYHAGIATLNLKNWFNWRDKLEQEVTQTTIEVKL